MGGCGRKHPRTPTSITPFQVTVAEVGRRQKTVITFTVKSRATHHQTIQYSVRVIIEQKVTKNKIFIPFFFYSNLYQDFYITKIIISFTCGFYTEFLLCTKRLFNLFVCYRFFQKKSAQKEFSECPHQEFSQVFQNVSKRIYASYPKTSIRGASQNIRNTIQKAVKML